MKKLLLMAIVVCFASANEPPCEVYDEKTDECIQYAPPYEDLNPEWKEFFVFDEPLDGELIPVKS